MRRHPRLGAREPARVRPALRLPRARLRRSPDDDVTSAGRITGAFLRLAQESERAGDELGAPTGAVPPKEHKALGGVRPALETPVSDDRIVRWLMAWTTVFGHVSMELFGHMHRGILDYDTHFRQVTGQLVADLGL